MTYEDARDSCHVRSAIYRRSQPGYLFWKNQTSKLDDRIPDDWKSATDWGVYDPRDDDPYAGD